MCECQWHCHFSSCAPAAARCVATCVAHVGNNILGLSVAGVAAVSKLVVEGNKLSRCSDRQGTAGASSTAAASTSVPYKSATSTMYMILPPLAPTVGPPAFRAASGGRRCPPEAIQTRLDQTTHADPGRRLELQLLNLPPRVRRRTSQMDLAHLAQTLGRRAAYYAMRY